MSKILNMPSFGSDMAQGTLSRWLVRPGDRVAAGDVIAVIETHKGAIEFDVSEAGQVEALLIAEGAQVPVGQPIARLSSPTAASQPPEPPHPLQPPEQAQTPAEQTEPHHAAQAKRSAQTAAQTAAQHRPVQSRPAAAGFIVASPAARREAAKRGQRLAQIGGSGPDGAVLLRDLSPLAEAAAPAREPPPQAAMREAISATVARSKREIPHYYLSHTLRLERLSAQLSRYNADLPPAERLILLAPLLCAVARTLSHFPELNGHYRQQLFEPAAEVALASALHLRSGGLVMPVTRQADGLSAPQMMAALSQQIERARSGSLRQSDLQGASCTVTSMGERGAETVYGVICPPQVAIIGLGKPRQQVVAEERAVAIRTVITATLAADHRVSDGHTGARFLHQLDQLLQQPEALWSTVS